nr:flagellar basal body rod protein FlgB [Clostridium haemolyticum]
MNNNIANFNTKGYKRSYVTFEDSLKESKDKLDLKITNHKHIAYKKKFGEINVKKDESDSMKMDGNNVDVDNEMTNLAANTLEYNALITTLNSTLSLKRYIINGGR